MIVGNVVKSAAGHDKERFFLIVELKGDFAFIVDGKYRKLLAPKKKRLKHLKKTNKVFDMSTLITDKQIRAALHPYNYGGTANDETTEGGNLLG